MKKQLLYFVVSLIVVLCGLVYFASPHNKIDFSTDKNINRKYLILSSINIDKKWDVMYILKPYDHNVEKFNIKMDYASKKDIVNQSSVDQTCTIIFTLNGKLVSYSFVSRSYFDFTKANRYKYFKKDVVILNRPTLKKVSSIHYKCKN